MVAPISVGSVGVAMGKGLSSDNRGAKSICCLLESLNFKTGHFFKNCTSNGKAWKKLNEIVKDHCLARTAASEYIPNVSVTFV